MKGEGEEGDRGELVRYVGLGKVFIMLQGLTRAGGSSGYAGILSEMGLLA